MLRTVSRKPFSPTRIRRPVAGYPDLIALADILADCDGRLRNPVLNNRIRAQVVDVLHTRLVHRFRNRKDHDGASRNGCATAPSQANPDTAPEPTHGWLTHDPSQWVKGSVGHGRRLIASRRIEAALVQVDSRRSEDTVAFSEPTLMTAPGSLAVSSFDIDGDEIGRAHV